MPADICKILFIVWLGTVRCSAGPGSHENGRHHFVASAEVNEEPMDVEYDEDGFPDYYQTTRNFNENSREFLESWSTEVFGSRTKDGTTLGDSAEGNFSTDGNGKNDNNETHGTPVEYMSENHKALLLQLRSSLKLDAAANTADPGHQQPMIPPQFMTDLYQTVTDRRTGITVHANPHDAEQVWSILETNPSVAGLFQFDLSNVRDDKLVEAELHVYRIGFDSTLLANRQPYYLLRVYQVMPTASNARSLHPDVHQLLNVHYVSAFGTGWQVFRVTRAVESWRNNTSPNLGLLVTATTVLNEPVDVRFSRKHQNSDNFQPSLILFTNGNGASGDKDSTGLGRIQEENFNSLPDTCRPKSLHVNFTELGWSTFIVKPAGFWVHQCVGTCTWPLIADQDATNHALVRTVLSKIRRGATSAACCVPTELDPISVLYKDVNGNFRLRRLDNMVVRKCACR